MNLTDPIDVQKYLSESFNKYLDKETKVVVEAKTTEPINESKEAPLILKPHLERLSKEINFAKRKVSYVANDLRNEIKNDTGSNVKFYAKEHQMLKIGWANNGNPVLLVRIDLEVEKPESEWKGPLSSEVTRIITSKSRDGKSISLECQFEVEKDL